MTEKEALEAAGVDKLCSREVKLEDVQVDMSYQREPSMSRVDKIAKDFSLLAITPPYISEREDGSLWCIDGNNTRLAAMKAGYERLRCVVVQGITVKQEALLFHLRNTARANPTKREIFKERLFRGEVAAVGISRCLKRYGFAVRVDKPGKHRVKKTITTLVGVEKIWASGGEKALDTVLKVVTQSWGTEDKLCVDAKVMRGVHVFCSRPSWVGKWDHDTLCKKLAKHGLVPLWTDVVQKAREFKGKKSRVHLFAKMMAEIYNKHLPKLEKLPLMAISEEGEGEE